MGAFGPKSNHFLQPDCIKFLDKWATNVPEIKDPKTECKNVDQNQSYGKKTESQ